MKFLQRDPHNRIEIKDALRHPWIKVKVTEILA